MQSINFIAPAQTWHKKTHTRTREYVHAKVIMALNVRMWMRDSGEMMTQNVRNVYKFSICDNLWYFVCRFLQQFKKSFFVALQSLTFYHYYSLKNHRNSDHAEWFRSAMATMMIYLCLWFVSFLWDFFSHLYYCLIICFSTWLKIIVSCW